MSNNGWLPLGAAPTSTQSCLPAALNGTLAYVTLPNLDNQYYIKTMDSGTPEEYLASIASSASWTGSESPLSPRYYDPFVVNVPSSAPTLMPTRFPTLSPTEQYSCDPGSVAIISFNTGNNVYICIMI